MKYFKFRNASLIALLTFSFASLPVLAGSVAVKNPNFSGSGVPDGWQAYPPADGTSTKIEAQPSGGTKMEVVTKGPGLGLAQWIPVSAGNNYTATVETEGTG